MVTQENIQNIVVIIGIVLVFRINHIGFWRLISISRMGHIRWVVIVEVQLFESIFLRVH